MDNPGTQRTGAGLAASADVRAASDRAADEICRLCGVGLMRAMDDQTRNDLLMLCRDYADYVNHPERFSADQARGAVAHILHVLLTTLLSDALRTKGPTI